MKKNFFETYIQHQEDIEYFLQESLKNAGSLTNHKKNDFEQLFTTFSSLELIYIVNKDTKIQTSENFLDITLMKMVKIRIDHT